MSCVRAATSHIIFLWFGGVGEISQRLSMVVVERVHVF